MINADGIKAFRGTMLFDPPDKRYRKALRGDFVHRTFEDGTGYWYNGWQSYYDGNCVDIKEEPCACDLLTEFKTRLGALNEIVCTSQNMNDVIEAIRSLENWVSDVENGGTER